MLGLKTKHYMLVAGFLAASGTMMSGLHGWNEVMTPPVLGGFFAQLAILVTSVFVEKAEAQ